MNRKDQPNATNATNRYLTKGFTNQKQCSQDQLLKSKQHDVMSVKVAVIEERQSTIQL